MGSRLDRLLTNIYHQVSQMWLVLVTHSLIGVTSRILTNNPPHFLSSESTVNNWMIDAFFCWQKEHPGDTYASTKTYQRYIQSHLLINRNQKFTN